MLLQRRRLREMQATLTTRERPVARMRLQVAHDLLLTRKARRARPPTVAPMAIIPTPAPADVHGRQVLCESRAGVEGGAAVLPAADVCGRGAVVPRFGAAGAGAGAYLWRWRGCGR